MRTINDWILVEPLTAPEQRGANKLITPYENKVIKWARVKQISGDVLADPEKKVRYAVNDVVVFYEKTGIQVYLKGKECAFMRWDGMLAIDDEYDTDIAAEEAAEAKRKLLEEKKDETD